MDDPEYVSALDGLFDLANEHALEVMVRLEHNIGESVWTIEVTRWFGGREGLAMVHGPSRTSAAIAALTELSVVGLS